MKQRSAYVTVFNGGICLFKVIAPNFAGYIFSAVPVRILLNLQVNQLSLCSTLVPLFSWVS